MRAPYPQARTGVIDPSAIEEVRWLMAVITGIRNIRGEMDISPAKPLPVLFQDGGDNDRRYLERNKHYLTLLARTESATWLAPGTVAPEAATALVGALKVLIPLGSLIDKQAEIERLTRELKKFEAELTKAKAKLANADFVARAPAAVVEQEQRRVREFETALTKLGAQRAQVEAMPDAAS